MAKKDEFVDGKTSNLPDEKKFNAAIETITTALLSPDLNGNNRNELINTLKAILDKFGDQKTQAARQSLATRFSRTLRISEEV